MGRIIGPMEPDNPKIQTRRIARMTRIDDLSPDIRACVHDYGFHVVNSFMEHGVIKAQHIRHLVETVLDEFSPTRGSGSAQGPRNKLSEFPHA